MQAKRGNDAVPSGTFSGVEVAYLPTDRDLGVPRAIHAEACLLSCTHCGRLTEHKEHAKMRPKNTICLWFNKDAHEAARFYAATFPDSEVTAVHEAPGDYPGGKAGDT